MMKHKIDQPYKDILFVGVPLSRGTASMVVLAVAIILSATLTFILNTKYKRRISIENYSVGLAISIIVGGALSEMIKMLLPDSSKTVMIAGFTTILCITAITVVLDIIYIIKGYNTEKK